MMDYRVYLLMEPCSRTKIVKINPDNQQRPVDDMPQKNTFMYILFNHEGRMDVTSYF